MTDPLAAKDGLQEMLDAADDLMAGAIAFTHAGLPASAAVCARLAQEIMTARARIKDALANKPAAS
jgi:hypothetical protein